MWPGPNVLMPKTATLGRFLAEYERAALLWMGQGGPVSPEKAKFRAKLEALGHKLPPREDFKVLPAEYELEHIERSRGQIIGSGKAAFPIRAFLLLWAS